MTSPTPLSDAENLDLVHARVAADMQGLLHRPERARSLLDLENHLTECSGLARALWELLLENDGSIEDSRTARAALALASSVADHASAAQLVFHKDRYADATSIDRQVAKRLAERE